MTYVEFHPSRVQIVITNLESLAESLLKIRRDIYDASDQNGHPVPSVDDTIDIGASVSADSSNPKTLAGAVESLTTIADELATRKREIIQLNSDGVITPNDDGTLSYYLPDKDDGTPVEDTLENFRAYNGQAAADGRADADALQKALEDSNYNYDDPEVAAVLARMSEHQDIPAYGAAFIDQYGLADYLEATHNDNSDSSNYYTLMTLSHVFAAATWADDGRNGTRMADELGRLIDDKSGWPNFTVGRYESALNKLLAAPDIPYDAHAACESGFLTNLAEHFENQDPTVVGITPTTMWTVDPMEGILAAMGYNPDAALAYLSPDGEINADEWAPGEKSRTRWELLNSDDWKSKHGGAIEPLSAVIAGASCKREKSDDTTDEQAAWVTGEGMSYFSDLVEDSRYDTPTIKNSIAIVLGNSLPDIEDVIANSGNGTGHVAIPADNNDPAPLPGDHRNAIIRLTREVGTDDAALTTLTIAVGRRSAQRTGLTLQAYPGVSLGTGSNLDSDLSTGATRDGHLLGFIEQSAVNARTKQGADEATAKQTVTSALVGGLSAGLCLAPHPVAQVAGVALAVVGPGAANAAGKPDLSAARAAQGISTDYQTQIHQSIVAQVANDGRLPEDAYKDANKIDYATNVDDTGKAHPDMHPFEWMGSDHQIDISKVLSSEKNQREFNSWLEDSSLKPVRGFGKDFDDGLTEGKKHAPED